MRLFDEKSTFGDILSDSKLKPFFKYALFGGIKPEEVEKMNVNDSFITMLDCANKMTKLIYENKIKIINFIENKNDINLIHFMHGNNSTPIIVVSGGSYYKISNCIEGFPTAIELYEKGFDVFVLNYSVYPNAMKSISELANAVKYILSNDKKLKINSSKYGCIGFSAAGHLVSQFGTNNNGYSKYKLRKPNILGLIYPVINLNYSDNGNTTYCYLGENPNKEILDKFSTNLHVGSDYPNVFMIASKNDCVVNPKNFSDMKKSLDDSKIVNYFKLYDSNEHGFSVSPNHPAHGWINDFIKFASL